MDSRKTLSKEQSFREQLEHAMNNGQPVNLLVDDEGIYRANGYIESVSKQTSSCTITLRDGKQILLSNIIAVNGLFLDDYSEC